MSYKSNYKVKNTNLINNKYQNYSKLKPLSIDENLYLLALVCTSNLETLKSVLIKNETKFDVNFNFVFKVPVQAELTNLVEEVSELVELNEYYSNVEEYIQKNKLMKRLFCYYNIKKLNSSFMLDMESDTIASSFDSGIGSFENGSFNCERNSKQEDLIEIVNNSIDKNIFFELTFLNIAIFLEDYECIKFILRHSTGIGALKPNQIHSLHLALYQNNNTILNMLLSHLTCEEVESGAINELSDDRGYNPLQIAVYYKNEEALSLLKSNGVDFNYHSKTSSHPLIWALESIDVLYNIILCLLKLGATPNCIDLTHGYTPLIVAVLADRLDLVQLLIEYKANVNQTIKNPTVCCALQVAIDRVSQTNSYEIVCALLSSGADPTFYQCVDENGMQMNNFGGPLIDSIASNNIYLVEKLLSFGANANTETNGSFSPICTACCLGRLEIVEILLKNKIDPLLKCKNSNTSLTIAISMNHQNIINILLPYYKTAESINTQDANGDHALLYAALNKNSQLVTRLLKIGANANLANKYKTTPLWYSVYNKDLDSFFALLPYTTDINVPSKGINYNGFQQPPELLYDRDISCVELAEEKDCFSMIYFFKIFGTPIPENIVEHLNSKLKHLKIAVKLKIFSSNSIVQKDLQTLSNLMQFLRKPLKLTELCRLYFVKEKHNTIDKFYPYDLPQSLKKFLSYRNYKL